MTDLTISTPSLRGSILGSAQFLKAWREAPKKIVPAVADGLARGFLGFRKEWLSTTEIKGLRKPRNRWIWIVRVGHRGTLDSITARLFPRKFHRSYLRFERGGSYPPRRARFHAIAFRWHRTKSGKARKGYQSPDAFRRMFGASRRLVPIKASGGRLILLEYRRSRGKWRRFKPAFLLLRRIRTPHRLKLRATWESPAARAAFIRRLDDTVDKKLKKFFGTRAS